MSVQRRGPRRSYGRRYSEDQPRDEHGRFGGGGPSWEQAKAIVAEASKGTPYGTKDPEVHKASTTTDHPRYFYHTSKTTNRESVAATGLEAGRSLGGHNTRIYLDSEKPEMVPRMDTAPHDLYEVDTQGMALRPDPELPGQWAIAESDIHSDRIKLLDTTHPDGLQQRSIRWRGRRRSYGQRDDSSDSTDDTSSDDSSSDDTSTDDGGDSLPAIDTTDVERIVVPPDDACAECADNDDPDELPIHANCDCQVATTLIDTGIAPEDLSALYAAAGYDGPQADAEGVAALDTSDLQPSDLWQYALGAAETLAAGAAFVAWRNRDSENEVDQTYLTTSDPPDEGDLPDPPDDGDGPPYVFVAGYTTDDPGMPSQDDTQQLFQQIKPYAGQTLPGLPPSSIIPQQPAQRVAGRHGRSWQRRYSEDQARGPDGRFGAGGDGEAWHATTHPTWGSPSPSWRPNNGQSMEPSAPRAPTAEDLDRAVQTWKGNPADLRSMMGEIQSHNGVMPWNQGGPSRYEDDRARCAALMNKVAAGEPTTKMLYRGAAIASERMASLTPGAKLSLPLTGFSEKVAVGKRYGRKAKDEDPWGQSGRTPVLFKLQAGARSYPIDSEEQGKGRVFANELEHIVAGGFEVVSVDAGTVSKAEGAKPVPIVTVRQTEPLTAPDGGWR